MTKKINEDGSIEGELFSRPEYKGGYPSPKYGQETFAEYRLRVGELVKIGFHLGDLGWGDWDIYCMGSGSYNGVNSRDIIGGEIE